MPDIRDRASDDALAGTTGGPPGCAADQFDPADEGYVAVPAVLLGDGSRLHFTLWHKQADSRMVPHRPAATPSQAPGDAAPPERLYVALSEYYLYRRRVESRVALLLSDTTLGERRFELARQVVVQLLAEMLESWPSPELVERIERVAAQIAQAGGDDALLGQWLSVRPADYSTAHHSLNVCLLGLLLARALGWEESERPTLATALLLHDAGKAGVPDTIWEREGRLRPTDWDLVRRHPIHGGAWLVHATGLDGRIVKVAARHHEQPNGEGYPSGMLSADLDPWSRLCAVVDTFDMLSSNRPFRAGLTARQAAMVLRGGSPGRLDREMVGGLARLALEGGLDRRGGAEDAVGSPDGPPGGQAGARGVLPLDSYLPLPPHKTDVRLDDRLGGGGDAAGSPNRRQFARHAYTMPCRVRYLRAGATSQDHISFWVTAVDLSRGGIQFAHDFPVPLGEVVSIFLPDGRRGRHLNAMVVRCRRGPGGAFFIAARFDYEQNAQG